MHAEILRKRWLQGAAGAPFHSIMTFVDGDLLLGRGVSLGFANRHAKATECGPTGASGKRMMALLTAAYGSVLSLPFWGM